MGFRATRRPVLPVIITVLTAALVALDGSPAGALPVGRASAPPDLAVAPAAVPAVAAVAVPSAPGAGTATLTNVARRSCPRARPGTVTCLSVWRHDHDRAWQAASAVVRTAVARPADGFGPPDIASAYRLRTSAGVGQTIAVVDAFDNPRAEADLATYRKAWGLSPCTTANGCFRKVNQRGGTKPPVADVGWGIEIDLDIQAVSAACPNCNILLVESDDNSFSSIGAAVNTAVRLGARVVSHSYGTDEFPGALELAAAYYTHPGVAQVASSGDFGYGPVQVPAAFNTVIAAGGTSLIRTRRGWTERAWSGTGSGCSTVVRKPRWQHDPGCSMRTVADVSALADPETGFAVYDTFGLNPYGGWLVAGGTSVSAPLVAGMIGLAGNSYRLDSARYIYHHSDALRDVVAGSTGSCGNYLCTAGKGYDGPTGLGSPVGQRGL